MRVLRLLRFRLRSVFIVMALLSGFLSCYIVNSQAVDRERHAVYSIQSMCGGGYVAVFNLDDEDDWLCGTGLAGVAEMKWRGPRWLRQPLERINAPILYRIQSIYLADTQVDDAVIEPLEKMKYLTEIDLSRTRITENGLQRIKEMFPCANVTHEPPRESSAETASVGDALN